MLKGELTARLDEVTRAAENALTLTEDLAPRLESPSLAERAREGRAVLQRSLEAVETERRRRGALPEAGEPERTHLEAVTLEVRAAFGRGPAGRHEARALIAAAGSVREAIAAALAASPDVALMERLEALEAACRAFERSLGPAAGY